METKTAYTFYEQTILNSINFDGYEIEESEDTFTNIMNAYKVFELEKGYEIKRVGEHKAFTDWLQGLCSACSVPFYNYEILANHKEYHGREVFGQMKRLSINLEPEIATDEEKKEAQEDLFLASYWNNLTSAFFTLKNNL